MKTTYSNYEQKPSNPGLFERRVNYKIDREFYKTAPTCVFVLTDPKKFRSELFHGIGEAFERHLRVKFKRVIGIKATEKGARKLGLDLRNKNNQKRFSRQVRCHTHAKIQIDRIGDTFLFVWAKRSISLSFKLVHTETGKILFKSKHVSERSNGGIPLSPITAPLSIARAAALAADHETYQSLADDAARRMLTPLPNLRNFIGALTGGIPII